ncbi:MAG: DUF3768 domain-containing protein [Roseovarius sp.]|nr:DUF3768 domain-containing protein [Roseovarius sp.]
METQTVDDIEHNTDLQAATIAAQNDLFRKTLIDPVAAFEMQGKGIQGQVLLTPGVSGEGAEFQAAALAAVASDTRFTEDNDPYGDHTFGTVTISGQKLFWKIDLYDLEFRYGSERPFDAEVTRRVLTIMCPSEY